MLKKIQAASGLLFLLFVIAHLINTWIAVFGAAAYDRTQSILRTVYQAAPVEALLLAALAVHVVVGMLRIFQEPRRTLTLRGRVHRYAGFFLVLVIGGHILAVRGASWFFDVYPGFAGLAFSLAAAPGYFYPYYFLLAFAGLYHGANGLGIALHRFGYTLVLPERRLHALCAGGAVLTLGALLGLGGILFEVGDVYQSGFALLVTEVTGVSFAP